MGNNDRLDNCKIIERRCILVIDCIFLAGYR